MDLEEIRTCCESLEQDITALRMTERIEYDFYSEMIDAVQTIAAEINESPKTNADRIRQMTDEELALEIGRIGRGICNMVENCDNNLNCYKCRLQWLKQEVDNG